MVHTNQIKRMQVIVFEGDANAEPEKNNDNLLKIALEKL